MPRVFGELVVVCGLVPEYTALNVFNLDRSQKNTIRHTVDSPEKYVADLIYLLQIFVLDEAQIEFMVTNLM